MSKQTNKAKSTFRFPFDIDRRIFLLLAAVFFIFSIKPINKLFFPRFDVDTLKEKIAQSYANQDQEFESFSKDQKLIEAFAKNTLSTDEIEELNENNWGLSLYKSNSLIAWSNERLLISIIPKTFNTPTPYNEEGTVGIVKTKKVTISNQDYILQANFPLYIKYKNENEYLISRFNITKNQKQETDDYGHYLKIVPSKNASKDYKHLLAFTPNATFALVEKADILDIYDKNPWHFFFAALPFIFFGISIHTFYKVSVKRQPLLYFILLVATAIIVRIANYWLGFPDNFAEFQLFNPDLYASSISRISLGDLFINRCLIFWILLFYLINIQFKVIPKHSIKGKYIIAFLSLIFLHWISVESLFIGKSLIMDSILNYDTTNYKNVTFEKCIGLFTFLIIFTNYVIAIIISHRYLTRITPIRGLRYLLVFIMPLISFFYSEAMVFNEILALAAWTALFYFLLDSKKLETKFDFNSYRLLYWIIILTVSCSFMFNYFIHQKEKTDRINIANQLLNFENPHSLDKIIRFEQDLLKDSTLQEAFKSNNVLEVNNLINAISLSNLNISHIANLEPILSSNTPAYEDLLTQYTQVNNKGLDPNKLSVYINSKFGKEKYLAILQNPNQNKVCRGVILKAERALTFHNNNAFERNNYGTFNSSLLENNYEIGFYENGVRTHQMGNTDFPYKLNRKKGKQGTKKENYYFTKDNLNTSTLVFFDQMSKNNRVILIRKKQNIFYQFSTTYAYIFSIIFLIISLYIIGNIVARSNFRWARFLNLIGLTLRMRIHLAILSVELIAFILIGFISIYYYSMRSENAIKQDTVLVSAELSDKLNASAFLNTLITPDSSRSENGIIQVNKSSLNKDYNIYSIKGDLLYSTDRKKLKSKIYTKKINPIAWYELKNSPSQNTIRKECLGQYEYLSSYNYLRASDGTPMAILQTPNLSAQSRTKREIASLIISLVNIYTLIFLLSSVIAFFITRKLTQSFTTIVSQFSKINLTKTNKPLEWPYSDEIGLLVKEYNRTLLKLENSTALLAKSERETAWREMAKQIAHEIKNPLTPMSLSLQTLQNAIKRDDPNLKEKTVRMTRTVLEQITVLTRIASNFSQFAKMSDIEAREESLREIIKSSTGIYTDSENSEFLFILPDKDITVFVDKVKLIRVLTNIIQNGLQAVPDNKTAYITLTVSKSKTNMIRVSVSDNGDGIPEELAQKIFEPKFTTKSSGSGLGLAMSKDIMNKSGGDISYETKMGKGTTFHIDIPVFIPEEDDLDLEDF